MSSACCPSPDLSWRQSRTGERWSDVYACRSCGHISALETYYLPLRWPGYDHCVNCGGDLVQDPAPLKCAICGLTPEKDRIYHESLAAAHPARDPIQAALAASDMGRLVLASKLATGAARWAEDHVLARTLRLQAMMGLGLLDRALDEGWDWASAGAPASVFGVIAELEVTAGNLPSAEKALRRGLDLDGTQTGMWADFMELLQVQGESGQALEASRRTLDDGDTRDRGLAVILEIAEAMHAEGQHFNAIEALSIAGPYEAASVPLAWLHARCALAADDKKQAGDWAATVVQLEPTHAEAAALFEQVNPAQKKGWFPWS